jgi:hypothetical protein
MLLQNCLKEFVVRSNDSERGPLDCETHEEADVLCAQLNAETDIDTKYWVEVKD